MIGRTISHYRIIETLGAGGMGIVYKAEDLRLGRIVAVKMVSEHLTDRAAIDRFELEARATSALNHPNICTIHEVDEADGRPFLVMELLDGQTLQSLIANGPLPFDRLLDLAIEFADALATAHAARIIHRDLKPGNLFVTSSGHLKILDFGLAKLLPENSGSDAKTEARLTKSHTTLGTLGYMSPEQLRGEPVDARSDLYSFGVVLSEAAGRNPGPLAPVITKALEKDREFRYQSAADIRADLKRLKHDSAARNVVQPAQRRPIALIVAIVIAMAATAAWMLLRKPAPRPSAPAAAVAAPAIHSLAVLPFKPIIAKERDEALEFGITDTLIAKISNIRGLSVRPLTAVRRYAGLEQDAVDAGRQLGVDAVLDGTTHNDHDRIRVTARLLRVSDSAQLWSGQFDTTFADIFAVYDAISNRLVSELSVKLSPAEQRELHKHDTQNPDAYRAYLLGRSSMGKLRRENLERAVDYFKQAVALDPDYALAYVGLANVYMGLPIGADSPSQALAEAAKTAALKAIAIDPELPDGYTALGIIKYWYDWDWAEAEKLFQRSIALNPNYSRSHIFYSAVLSCQGRNDESIREAQIAQKLEPLWIQVNIIAAQDLMLAQRNDEAIEQVKRSLEANPESWVLRLMLGKTYEQKRMFDAALENYENSWKNSSGETEPLARIGHLSAIRGDTARARDVLTQLTTLSKQRYVPPYNVALVQVGLGQKDQALQTLLRACRERDARMVFLGVDPALAPLRSDPGFAQVAACAHQQP
jgi:TolB-like protein/Flp pilus assembly protein TadD